MTSPPRETDVRNHHGPPTCYLYRKAYGTIWVGPMNEAIRAQTTAGMRGWQEETVTQATTAVEFDPFSMEFYNGAQDIYARLRAEAPVYYNEQYDFYALSRHADVAPAYRDYETFSSARASTCRRSGPARTPLSSRSSPRPTRASLHAKPGQQGVHTARHRGSAGDGHRPHRVLPESEQG